MKYLLFDTNIYINMIVNRRNNISTKTITDFAALVAVGGIEIILPEIVKYETYKHLEKEIDAIGSLLDRQISDIKKLYWLTGFQEDEIDFKAYKRNAQKPLRELLDIFNRQHYKYALKLKESIKNIFNSEHTKVIDTSEVLIQRVIKRKIYKKAPLHREGKEFLADALIAETLIDIKSYINLNSNDTIYFITENYRDFSLDKNNKETFHPHIEDDLEIAGFRSQVKLINSFEKLLSCELQDEIKNAHMDYLNEENRIEETAEKYFDMVENEIYSLLEKEIENSSFCVVNSPETKDIEIYDVTIAQIGDLCLLFSSDEEVVISGTAEVEAGITVSVFDESLSTWDNEDKIYLFKKYNTQEINFNEWVYFEATIPLNERGVYDRDCLIEIDDINNGYEFELEIDG